MRRDSHGGIGVALSVLILMWWSMIAAAAEPSDACRGLAAHFATAPAELDARYLAALMVCVSTEVGERLQVAQVMPPPSPEAERAPAPPPDQPVAPPPPKPYGEWPAPSPWAGEWPTSSWDR